MGCTSSTTAQADKKITNLMATESKRDKHVAKILILGPGDSGKTTYLKGLQFLTKSFPEDERQKYVPLIRKNVVDALSCLVEGIPAEEQPAHVKATMDHWKTQRMYGLTPEQLAQWETDMEMIWSTEPVQTAFRNRHSLQFPEAVTLFIQNLKRISNPSFAATNEDVLHARSATTGIKEVNFSADKVDFRLVDVGGQRAERRKWIHCFENSSAVLFVTDVTDYCKVLYEDERVNRMDESLALFENVCTNKWFSKIPIILFLNKSDLLPPSLKKSPLKNYFADFTGGDNVTAAYGRISKEFKEVSQRPKIYVHHTSCIQMDKLQELYEAMKRVVMSQSLVQAGLADQNNYF